MDVDRSTAAAKAAGDVGLTFSAGEVVATRGELLALIRHGVGTVQTPSEEAKRSSREPPERLRLEL